MPQRAGDELRHAAVLAVVGVLLGRRAAARERHHAVPSVEDCRVRRGWGARLQELNKFAGCIISRSHPATACDARDFVCVARSTRLLQIPACTVSILAELCTVTGGIETPSLSEFQGSCPNGRS